MKLTVPAAAAAAALFAAWPTHGLGAEQPARDSLCLMIESAAQVNGLPAEFLTRVIWRESRFDRFAIGPQTRSGARAEGIAQFMPATAAERALGDPFDPVEALPKAAAFLHDLREAFGNLGLAAAAYNAGPQRVRGWLAGTRTMPGETRSYVVAVTGRSVEEWARAGRVDATSPVNCTQTLAALDVPPGAFAYRLEQRVAGAIAMPWGVELAAGFSRVDVLTLYARAVQRLPAVIGERDLVIVSTMLRSRGTGPFYQARIGTETRPAANELCARIRKAGGACLVTRNTPGRYHVEDMEAERREAAGPADLR